MVPRSGLPSEGCLVNSFLSRFKLGLFPMEFIHLYKLFKSLTTPTKSLIPKPTATKITFMGNYIVAII